LEKGALEGTKVGTGEADGTTGCTTAPFVGAGITPPSTPPVIEGGAIVSIATTEPGISVGWAASTGIMTVAVITAGVEAVAC